MEDSILKDVILDHNKVIFSITGIENTPGKAFEIFSALSGENINIDVILQVMGEGDKKDIMFTADEGRSGQISDLLNSRFAGIYGISCEKDISKISVTGSAMVNHPGIAAKIFDIIGALQIDIRMVSTSEMSISLFLNTGDADAAYRALLGWVHGRI